MARFPRAVSLNSSASSEQIRSVFGGAGGGVTPPAGRGHGMVDASGSLLVRQSSNGHLGARDASLLLLEDSSLMSRLVTVSLKAELLLLASGRGQLPAARPRTAPATCSPEAVEELKERLQRLELLLDEVMMTGSLHAASDFRGSAEQRVAAFLPFGSAAVAAAGPFTPGRFVEAANGCASPQAPAPFADRRRATVGPMPRGSSPMPVHAAAARPMATARGVAISRPALKLATAHEPRARSVPPVGRFVQPQAMRLLPGTPATPAPPAPPACIAVAVQQLPAGPLPSMSPLASREAERPQSFHIASPFNCASGVGTMDQKLRQWLRTIPIGRGEQRGWDDAQIADICEFARSRQLEHLAAEAVYKHYVEHLVERASFA